MVCWATTLCSLIGDYQQCAGSYHLHLHLYLEHEGNMVLWNTSNHPSEKHTVNADMKRGISGFSAVGFGLQCTTSDSALHVECLEVSETLLWKCHFAVTLLFILITWSLCTTSHHHHSDCKTPLPLSCSHSYLKLQLLCKSRCWNCFNIQNCWMA